MSGFVGKCPGRGAWRPSSPDEEVVEVNPDGLSRSANGEDDWPVGGPSNAPRSERFGS